MTTNMEVVEVPYTVAKVFSKDRMPFAVLAAFKGSEDYEKHQYVHSYWVGNRAYCERQLGEIQDPFRAIQTAILDDWFIQNGASDGEIVYVE